MKQARGLCGVRARVLAAHPIKTAVMCHWDEAPSDLTPAEQGATGARRPQISACPSCVEALRDCEVALSLEPGNFKAHLRRVQALTACKLYKVAWLWLSGWGHHT
jgi:hypothetical protein